MNGVLEVGSELERVIYEQWCEGVVQICEHINNEVRRVLPKHTDCWSTTLPGR